MKHIRTTLKHPKKYRTKNYIQHKSTQKINIDILSSLSYCPFYDQSRADTRARKCLSPCPSPRSFKKVSPTLIRNLSNRCLVSKCCVLQKFQNYQNEIFNKIFLLQNHGLGYEQNRTTVNRLGQRLRQSRFISGYNTPPISAVSETQNYPNKKVMGLFYTGI